MQLEVTLVAWTTMNHHAAKEATGGAWSPSGSDPMYRRGTAGELAEFGGRACYASWAKPNPNTATNQGYLSNILDHDHLSVLEHGSATLYATGISRALTHELVRHRHMSPSQLSQRFVTAYQHPGDEGKASTYVTPPLFEGDDQATFILNEMWEAARAAYDALIQVGETRVREMGIGDATMARKLVREAARAVLPNMSPTAIVLTGNHRAWRDLLLKRATQHADAEIHRFAMAAFQLLNELEPNIYQDLLVVEDPISGRRILVQEMDR